LACRCGVEAEEVLGLLGCHADCLVWYLELAKDSVRVKNLDIVWLEASIRSGYDDDLILTALIDEDQRKAGVRPSDVHNLLHIHFCAPKTGLSERREVVAADTTDHAY
jgi:hypothetical protein